MAQKLPMHRTPEGVAIYPSLVKPDTRFNADGVFKLKLRLPFEDAEGVLEVIDAAFDEQLAVIKKERKGKKVKEADKPYEMVVNEEGEETGEVDINFKMNHVVRPQNKEPFSQKPDLFDAKGNKFTPRSIWGGSKVKVAFQIQPYFTAQIGSGVTLRLKAVQVIELVEGGGGSAESYGFGEEEGYEAPADTSPFDVEEDDAPDTKPAGKENDDF